MGFARWLILNPALRGSCGPIPVLRAARLKIASHVGQKCLLAHICILDLLEIPTILAALLPAPVSRPLTPGLHFAKKSIIYHASTNWAYAFLRRLRASRY